jgi:hypothetical protein
MKVVISLSLPHAPMPPRGHGFQAARGSEETDAEFSSRTRLEPSKIRPATIAPRALSCSRAATQLTHCQPQIFKSC